MMLIMMLTANINCWQHCTNYDLYLVATCAWKENACCICLRRSIRHQRQQLYYTVSPPVRHATYSLIIIIAALLSASSRRGRSVGAI